MPVQCLDFCNGVGIVGPLSENVLGPYVRMTIQGTNFDLTVGNASLPDKQNTACIKSFQYGQDDGNGAEMEIADEAGSEFSSVMQYLITNMGEAVNKYKVQVVWGWILADCDNGNTRCVQTTQQHTFVILGVDINIAKGGMFIYRLQLSDLIQLELESTITKNIGEDIANKKIDLKEAIRELFRQACPPVKQVDFLRVKRKANTISCSFGSTALQPAQVSCGGTGASRPETEEFDFENFTTTNAQPAFKWEAGNNSALAAARSWVLYYMTKRKKGIITFWDSTVPGGRLVFLEDPLPACPNDDTVTTDSIGTYIVNGGTLSPVIEFSPQIKWTFAAFGESGAVVDPGGPPAKMQGPSGCDPNTNKSTGNSGGNSGNNADNKCNVGTSSRGSVPDDKKANGANARNTAQSIAANEKANKPAENIEAELRIQGDPSLDDPFVIKTRTVAIMVVNPFHLRGPNPKGCAEWLSQPPCNNCLSNKNWVIRAVSHEIKDGSYTTTLKLLLPSPCDNL